jgi:hypothetical protein
MPSSSTKSLPPKGIPVGSILDSATSIFVLRCDDTYFLMTVILPSFSKIAARTPQMLPQPWWRRASLNSDVDMRCLAISAARRRPCLTRILGFPSIIRSASLL